MDAKEMLEMADKIQIGNVLVERGDSEANYPFTITNVETGKSVSFSSDEGFQLCDIIDAMQSKD